MRLTKTERALLEKALRKDGQIGAMTWWSSSSRLLKTHGGREADALKSLVRKGLADNFVAESNHSPNSNGWGSTYATEFSAKITEAGRAALNN